MMTSMMMRTTTDDDPTSARLPPLMTDIIDGLGLMELLYGSAVALCVAIFLSILLMFVMKR